MLRSRLQSAFALAAAVALLVVLSAGTAVTTQSLLPTLATSSLLGCITRGLVSVTMGDWQAMPIVCNSRGDQMVAQALPANAELVRMGNSYQTISTAAITALTSTPTTTAAISLWNGEAAGGRLYIIDAVGWVKIVADTTQVDETALFVMNNKSLPITAPTSALTPVSLAGRRNYGGRGIVGTGVTVTNDTWFPIGTQGGMAGTAPGTGWGTAEYPINGTYIVPPGGMFSIQLSEITATASKFQAFIRWHEVQLPIGF